MVRLRTTFDAGYSLLEMLVVVSILAAVAFVTTGAYTNVIETSGERLVLTEMQEIAAAIRQFKQDTGYFPKTGPFALEEDDGAVTDASLMANFPHSGSTQEARENWFYSTANFYQVLGPVNPLTGSGHMLESWNSETGRGWRGPYLSGVSDGYVDIGNDISIDPPGSPLNGNHVEDVDGIADPFMFRGIDNLLDWSRRPRPDRVEVEKWGRPYLLLEIDEKLSLVSMGPDGDYGTDDDIVLPLE